MITKILVTLAVIMICMWLVSARARSELREVTSPATLRSRRHLRNGAIAFMVLMVVAATVMIYLEADKQNTVVTVRVINTQSGAAKSYRVRKSEIHSDGFTTLDGLQVFVAGIERIEIESAQ